jgi:two-component system CitB family response regulator
MSSIRLLIVEDDRQIAEIQRRFVERLDGVELSGIAHTLTDARDLIEVLQPDLLLLDVHFPDGNGLDLLRELRARDRATDVILITAAREVNTLRSALHGGVFDYILKPLVYERLEAIQHYRQHLTTLAGLHSVAQKEVDALLPRGHGEQTPEPTSRLPKGIDALTLDKIRSVVQGPGNWSAEVVGQQIGASRTTARRYLEHLVSTGDLTAEVNYGTIGRPERRYRYCGKPD